MAPREDGVLPVQPIARGRIGFHGLLTPAAVPWPVEGFRPAGSDASARDEFKMRLQAEQARLSIEKDEGSGKIVVRLTDPHTGELIRQIPPEEMLKIAEAMERYLGLLVDGHR